MSQGGTGGGGGREEDRPRRTSGGPGSPDAATGKQGSNKGSNSGSDKGSDKGSEPAAQHDGKQAGKQAGRQTGTPAGTQSAARNSAQRAGRRAGQRGGQGSGQRAGQGGGQGGGVQGKGRRRARWLRQVNEYSAGGLVVDLTSQPPRGALIARADRHGKLLWSLPKGHIEQGETAEQAAVREVEEETGIAGVILAELGTIDFWFVADGRRIHKTVQHYLMRATGGELSDADIEVSEVAWVPLPDIRGQLAYPDERGLVDTAGRLLADTA